MKTSATLLILDGYALAPPSPGNAIAAASTPVLDRFFRDYPHTTLSASGIDVGLPEGQIGNSEVGHMNIGAGRVVYQDLTRISRDIELGGFFDNSALTTAARRCAGTSSALHLMGLLSPGGVHSHEQHLWALLELARRCGAQNVYIHCFLDGRDVMPGTGADSVALCADKCRELGIGKIATVMGRFYAMDRDSRWDRLELAYKALTLAEGEYNPDPVDAVRASYAQGVTDEFVKPIICDRDGVIKSGDSVIFFNFRSDRARELTRAFTDTSFAHFKRGSGQIGTHFVCMTEYDETLTNVAVAYPTETITDTLGETLSRLKLRQLRIAETEKYAHVTFFLNGGVERVFPGEERILIPSPRDFATYDLIPEMSARRVTEAAAKRIREGLDDVVIINLANCDMVGHTGVLDATVKAVETVDECVGLIADAVVSVGGFLLVTADHGNAEVMLDAGGGQPNTAHSTNPVPLIIKGADVTLHPGRLCDIAPTLLWLLGLEKPEAMTGESLIVR